MDQARPPQGNVEQMHKFMKDRETSVGLQEDRGEDSSVCVSLVKLLASHLDIAPCFGFCFLVPSARTVGLQDVGTEWRDFFFF